MQRRRKPRLLPRKIGIQPSPRTLKHRRSRTICRTHRRHPTGTRNRIGTYDILRILFEQRRAKVLLPLKPKPRQTAAISGKQDFAQRRSKRRRDHQRLLSKLRNIIPRIVQTTPIGPKVTQGSRRERAAAAGRAPQSPKAAGAKRQGRRRDQGPQQPRAPTSAQRPQPTTAPSQAARSSVTAGRAQQRHRRPRAAASPQAARSSVTAGRAQQRHRRRGPGLVFRTLRRPVWRLVRGSEGAGQGATHGRGRSEN